MVLPLASILPQARERGQPRLPRRAERHDATPDPLARAQVLGRCDGTLCEKCGLHTNGYIDSSGWMISMVGLGAPPTSLLEGYLLKLPEA